MVKRKQKIKISDKALGIMIGIAITLSAIGLISALSISSADTNGNSNSMNMIDGDMHGMMGEGMMANGNMMPMMHMMMGDSEDMMNDQNGMMSCMSMMKNSGMTEEETEEMLKTMDEDGDGFCDYCGMSIEACRKMMS